MTDLITVQGTSKEKRVILWESHPLHVSKENPTGEVFIASEDVAKVGKTPAVKRHLQSGELVEVTKITPPPPIAVPFTGYDEMTVSEITRRMASMTDAEKDTVRRYERANRNRKAILEA